MESTPDTTRPLDHPLAEEETLLFVYGTLKRGQANHGRLLGARLLGQATLEGARLFDLGPFPMAVAGDGRVVGELYAVPWLALSDLDAFEGCPRLYQRQWLPLADGRAAWTYLGQPRQVRHVPWLEDGRWPEPGTAWRAAWRKGVAGVVLALAGSLLGGWLPLVARGGAFDTLGACQAWQSSRGRARLELGNAIGAAHYLTKTHPFQESTAQAPVELYSPADIQRVCGRP